MSRTIVGLGDPKAIKKYSAFLAVDNAVKSWWGKSMMGVGETAMTPVQMLEDLSKSRGEMISYELVMQLRQPPTEGDNIMAGNEEELRFFTDQVYVNQARHGTNSGGKMAQQRTIHNLRSVGRSRITDYIARLQDELFFMYAAGARGINSDYVWPTTFTSFANNALQPVNPTTDPEHILYGGAATSKASLVSTDVFDTTLLNKAYARVSTVGGGSGGIPQVEPCKIDGEDHYVLLMHIYQDYALRQGTGVGGWADVQKTLVMKSGTASPLFNGSQGVWNGMILQKHKKLIRFNDYGAGSNVNACRALLLGRQAMVCAYAGEGSQQRFSFWEDTEDRGNIYVAGFESIFGIKKTQFTIDGVARDFGVVAVDTAIPASI